MTRLGQVAYVCTDPGVPVFGTKGSSVHVRSVLTELVRRAEHVTLLASRIGGPVPAALRDVEVHELPRPVGAPAQRERDLVAADDAVAGALAFAGNEFDLVYQRYALWSCAAMELARARGWPSALEINAPLLDEQLRHRVLVDAATAGERTRRALAAANVAFAVSPGVSSWAAAVAGRAVATVPNGVDASRFAAGPRRRSDGPLVIGFIGTFKPWHALDLLVDAVRAVRADATVPPLELLLVGDGPELPRVLARAEAIGLRDVVRTTGSVAPDDVPEILRHVDVAIAPYAGPDHYFSPIKVFEYLAAGLPVVVSDVGGLGALLQNGIEALIVPPGDLAAHAAALHAVCTDADLRARLGATARHAAATRLGWDLAVDRILDLVRAGSNARRGPNSGELERRQVYVSP